MPYPDDPSVSHGSGPNPDRVLLLGGTLVRGIGVRSNELGIPGNLARKLAARTGNGADIEALGIPMLTVARVGEELRAQNIRRFDAIVLMLGNSEVLTMRPLSLWRRDLIDLMATIDELTVGGPPVILCSIPPVATAFDVAPIVRRRLIRGIRRMNEETAKVCAESGVANFVSFDDLPAPTVGSRAAETYELWAEALTGPVACAIASASPDLHLHAVAVDESERQRALDQLGVGTDPDALVDRIVEMARDMLGVPAASLTIIDRDRHWVKAASGIPVADIPRSESICNTTIQSTGVYIVEDVEATSHSTASWVTGDEHIRSYAGYPLEAPGGLRIGALCVMDRSPRRFSSDEVATLRDLALRAQFALWTAPR